MKKSIIGVALGMMLLCGCGKETEVVREPLPDEVFTISDYHMTLNVREEGMMKAAKGTEYILTHENGDTLYYGSSVGNTYFKKIAADNTTSTFINGSDYENLWTHDPYELVFEEYDKTLHEYFTSANVGLAESNGQAELTSDAFGGEKYLCDVYTTSDTSNIRIWDPEEKYTAMQTDFYVYDNNMIYATIVLTNDTQGFNTTITYNALDHEAYMNIPDEEYFMTLQEYENIQAGLAMNDEGQTIMDIMEVSEDDIKNENANGYYYEDGTFVYSHPQNMMSWKHIVDGKTVEEFDQAANKYTNYETGEVRENVVITETYTDADGNEQTYVSYNNVDGNEELGVGAQDVANVFDYSIGEIKCIAITGVAYGPDMPYTFILNYDEQFMKENPDLVPADIIKKAETIYNEWSLQSIIDKCKNNSLKEDEKYIIAVFAHDKNMVISATDYMYITLVDLLNNSGLDINQYYTSFLNNEAPFLPMASYRSGIAGPVNTEAPTEEPVPTEVETE